PREALGDAGHRPRALGPLRYADEPARGPGAQRALHRDRGVDLGVDRRVRRPRRAAAPLRAARGAPYARPRREGAAAPVGLLPREDLARLKEAGRPRGLYGRG